ncbi:hypothetical protein ACIHDR_48275, partial [Nocardia sp. NPDC052278]
RQVATTSTKATTTGFSRPPGATRQGRRDADWEQIADLYAALGQLSRLAVVAVNHAAAVGFAEGPRAGLDLLGPLLTDSSLPRYQPLHATHADLLNRAGDQAAAADAYRRAISLTQNAVEQTELERRLAALTTH